MFLFNWDFCTLTNPQICDDTKGIDWEPRTDTAWLVHIQFMDLGTEDRVL